MAAELLSGALALAVIGIWVWVRRRPTSAERERRRRLAVNRSGRMADGTVTDVQGGILYYSYSVRGAGYTASQDIAGLEQALACDPAALVGPVTVKYSVRNPADSIVVCEEWSGLRTRH